MKTIKRVCDQGERILKRLLLVLCLCASPGVNASLINQTITCENSTPSSDPTMVCGSPSAVVGAGVEFTLTNSFSQSLTVDVDESSVRIAATASAQAIKTLTLGDLIWSNDPSAIITGIDNLVLSGISGDTPIVTTLANSVSIDFGNSSTIFAAGSFMSFDLVTTHTSVPAPVPTLSEWGTIILASLLFGLAFLRLKHRRSF